MPINEAQRRYLQNQAWCVLATRGEEGAFHFVTVGYILMPNDEILLSLEASSFLAANLRREGNCLISVEQEGQFMGLKGRVVIDEDSERSWQTLAIISNRLVGPEEGQRQVEDFKQSGKKFISVRMTIERINASGI